MKEIVPGIWSWSVFNPEKKLNFNGWYVVTEREAVVVDPPTPSSSVLEFIVKTKRPVAVLLTNKHPTRAGEVFRRTF